MTFSRLILTCALTAMLATPALARHGDDDDDDHRSHESHSSHHASRGDSHHRGHSSDDDRNRQCTSAPQSAWRPLAEIEATARKMGYAVWKIERDGSCYEVYATRGGRNYELYFDPATGQVVKTEED